MGDKISCKIHILFPFQEGPKGGGGNQFLKALKSYWQGKGFYEDSIEKADVVLFNSHQWFKKTVQLKKKFPSKVFIHRIDGPLRTYRPKEAFLDRLIFKTNKFVADGTIWQSKWSQKENKKLFPYKCPFETVVYNAPNEQLFNKQNKSPFNKNGKIKIIAVSWSTSALKGFDIYKFLDNNLNFKKYQMTFVGRSPIEFKNIKSKGPMEQAELAKQIKQNDIFITASKIESCSNALIEALSCGLPCLAFNASSNPEVVGRGGELFEGEKDILQKIEKVANNYQNYQKNLPVFSLEKVAKAYFDFGYKLFDQSQSGFYFPRQVGAAAILVFIKERALANIQKVINKVKK